MHRIAPEHARLTLVIAAYNEEEALPALQPRIVAALDMAEREGLEARALYVDDMWTGLTQCAHAWPVCAPHAHARVSALDSSAALKMSGVLCVLTAADVPSNAIHHQPSGVPSPSTSSSSAAEKVIAVPIGGFP